MLTHTRPVVPWAVSRWLEHSDRSHQKSVYSHPCRSRATHAHSITHPRQWRRGLARHFCAGCSLRIGACRCCRLFCKEYISRYRKSLRKWLRKITTLTGTSSRPMWTTIMTPSTPTSTRTQSTTCATCTSEHSSAPLVVFPVSLMTCHDPLGSSSLSLSSHVIRMSHLCVSL